MELVAVSIVVPTCGRTESSIQLIGDLLRAGILARSGVEVIFVQNEPAINPNLRQKIEEAGARYAHQPRRGQAAALNEGIRIARGKYIVFIDDDVRIINGEWLDRLLSHFAEANVGYVSGNVIASELTTPAQRAWEAKGGLSKGRDFRCFDQAFFRKRHFGGVPLRFIACGANSAIPKRVLIDVGLYDERFGVGSSVGHSQSHEICYKILRAGYCAIYDPAAVVLHDHPKTWSALRRRMYNYGIGDTAVQFHFFLTYGDYRGLREALMSRHLYLLGNLLKCLRGKYPMPASTVLAGMLGALLGPIVYLRASLFNDLESGSGPPPSAQ